MKTQLQIILRLSCIVLIIALSNKSFAEGTREIKPLATDSGGIEFRFPNPSSMTTFALYGCPVDYRLNIHVNAGEIVYYGFALKIDNSLIYRIKDPSGNIVAGGGTVPAKGQTGYINSYVEAVAGPAVVAANGYNALSFTATQTGDYYIEFNQNNGVSLVNISLFDITVVKNGVVKNGRLWSKAWQVSTNNATAQFGGAFYIYSDDQVVTKIDLRGIAPYVFSVAANQFGCFNTGNFTDDRKSVLSAFAVNPQYKVFLNDPDIIEFPTGTLGDIISVDVRNNNSSSCTIGYCIDVDVSKSGNVDVLLNFNGIPGFQAGTTDITLSAKVQSGKNCIEWNGKDGLGNVVSALNNVSVEVDYMNGLTNLPLYDVEQATTGFQVSLVRPVTGLPINLFWDDTKAGGIANFIGCLGQCHSFSGNENTINSWWYVSKKSQKQVVNLTQTYTPLNFDYCATNGATVLTLNDGNAYTWYKDAAATIPINNDIALSSGVAVSWTPSAGTSGDQTLYYTKAVSVAGKIGPSSFNQTDWSGANPPLGTLMVINVLNATQFKSFEVNAGWKINNATLYTFTINGVSKTISLSPNTTTTVNMNITLPAGTYTLTSSGGLMYNNVMGTTSIPNTVTLANSGNNSAYANMVFNASSDCAPLTAIAHETCCIKPIITTQPSNVTVVVNGSNTATFSVVATGTGTLTYQWQTDNGTGTFTDIVGANDANYTTSVVTQAMNDYKYQCIVSLNGACSVTTSQAKITTSIQTCIPPVVTNPVAICQNGVSPDLSLHATALTGNILNWYSVATGGTSSLTTPTLSTSTVGTQDVWVSQSINGCESARAKISFTVHPLPNVSGTATPSTICFGSSTILKGAGAITYTWDNGATDNVAFNPSATAIFTVTGTDINGCKNTDTVNVTVNTIPSAPLTTNPTAICQFTTLPDLNSNVTGSNLLWYTNLNGGTGTSIIPVLSASVAGSFDVFVSQTINNCESTRSKITLTVNAGPNAPTTTNPTPVCLNENVPTLTASGTNLLWYSTSTGGISSVNAPILKSDISGTFDYWVSQSALGCEGPRAKISFKVNSLPIVTAIATPSTICDGENTILKGSGAINYTWDNGVVDNQSFKPTSTKSYTLIGSDVNTCKDTIQVTVTVNPIPAIPTVTNPADICQNGNVPDLSQSVVGNQIRWYNAAIGGVGSVNPIIAKSNLSGSFDVYVSQTILNCESARTKITYTIVPTPAKPTVQSPINSCKSSTTNLSASASGQLKWYTSETSMIGSTSTPIVNTSSVGQQNFWVTNNQSNCESEKVKIQLFVIPNPELEAIVPDFVCSGDSLNVTLNFTGFSPFTLLYQNQGFTKTLQARTLSKQLVLKADDDSNIEFLKLTDSVCSTIYQNFIENYVVNQLPKLTIISSDTVCSASNFRMQLFSNMPNTYIDWTVSANTNVSGASNGQFMGTSTNILQTLTNKTANIQYLEYKFNTTNNSCIGETKQMKIVLMPSFILKINTPNQVCNGDSIDFSIGNSVAGYQVVWFKNGSIIPNKNTFTINEVITGDDYYEVQATDYCGTTQVDGVSSSIYQPVHFGKLTALDSCAKFMSNLNISTPENINSVTWNLNNSLINSVVHHNIATLNYQFPDPQEYPMNIKGYYNGCLLADTSIIFKTKDCSVNTVNSFTPNNDGANDKWVIQGIENYTNASLSIFNRWGVKVKSHSGIIPNEAWDGTNESGELLETGTYYYVLEVRRGIDIRKGYITLMKD